MTTQGQRIVTLLLIFLLGTVAGSGLGFLYGKDTANTELQQELTEVQNRFETVNQNYLILVREYNKLFKLSGPAVQPVAAVPAVESETYQVPAPGESEAKTEAEMTQPTPEPETTAVEEPAGATETEEVEGATDSEAPAETTATDESPESADSEETSEPAAKPAEADEETTAEDEQKATSDVPAPEAEFEAESIGGTGPLEGPPPQPFRFKDLSTGDIESWEWDFGDGETSTEQDPEHTYRQCPNDLCTVKLTVCGPGGCDTEVKEDYLWVSEGCSGC